MEHEWTTFHISFRWAPRMMVGLCSNVERTSLVCSLHINIIDVPSCDGLFTNGSPTMAYPPRVYFFFFRGFARVHFLLDVMFFQCQFIARLWHALPNNMYRLQHLALCLGIPWATQCVCVRVVFFDRAYVIACRKLPFLLHLEMIRIPAERFDCHNILCFFFLYYRPHWWLFRTWVRCLSEI